MSNLCLFYYKLRQSGKKLPVIASIQIKGHLKTSLFLLVAVLMVQLNFFGVCRWFLGGLGLGSGEKVSTRTHMHLQRAKKNTGLNGLDLSTLSIITHE